MKSKFYFGMIACMLLLLAACAAAPQKLNILYTTDTHGYIISDQQTIGLDLIAAVKQDMPASLLLDAGDYVQGQPAAGLSQGRDVLRLMQETGYLAIAVGNHEFDYGLPVLNELHCQAQSGGMYMLAANIVDYNGNHVFQPYLITSLQGIKIGIFAITTPETASQAGQDKLAGIKFLSIKESAQQAVHQLKQAGCRVIIALTHVGSDPSIPYKSTDLAEDVPGIDLIIDGHSHVPLNYRSSQGSLVVSSGAYARSLGLVEIDIAERIAVGSLLDMEKLGRITPQPQIRQYLLELEQEINRQLGAVLGETHFTLNGEREQVRTGSTNLGNLCADVARLRAGADVAVINGGGIRGSIGPGVITQKEVFTVLPFGNYLLSKQVSGRELKDMLETGLAKLPGLGGGFPQISGITVRANAANPPGHRVLAINLDNGRPFALDAMYILATNDFLAQGGDSYPHLADKPVYKTFAPLHQEVMDYIRQYGVEAYAPGAEQRILFE